MPSISIILSQYLSVVDIATGRVLVTVLTGVNTRGIGGVALEGLKGVEVLGRTGRVGVPRRCKRPSWRCGPKADRRTCRMRRSRRRERRQPVKQERRHKEQELRQPVRRPVGRRRGQAWLLRGLGHASSRLAAGAAGDSTGLGAHGHALNIGLLLHHLSVVDIATLGILVAVLAGVNARGIGGVALEGLERG